MAEKDEFLNLHADSDDSDEVEIIEVVGVDDDPVSSAERLVAGRRGDDEAQEDSGEVLLAFDDDEEGESVATSAVDLVEPTRRSEAQAPADDEMFLRLQADYDNLRKRVDRERGQFEIEANCMLVGKLLPIIDNFERALSVGNVEQDPGFRDGVGMIYKQFVDELRRQGLHPIAALGEPFDPQIHDAVATEESPDAEPNTVIEELRRGYLFRNRLLRPAMVKVSTPNGVPSAGSEPSAEEDSRG